MASEIKVDTISEKTSANGVSIDSVVHKDSAVYPSSADGGALGSASNEWSDLFLADSSVIKFGADQDTTLTHTDGTGLTLNSTNKLCFNDTGTYVGSNADGDIDVVSDGTAVDSINIESAGGVTLDAGTAGSGVIYEDDGTEMLRIHNSSSDVIVESKVSDKDIIIKGNDGGSTATALTFDMSDKGTMVLGAHGGITFPATQNASSGANTLDDYEEGTWTPDFQGTSGSAGDSNTTVQGAKYTKIGRVVTVTSYVSWADKGSWSGDWIISGLPFTSGNDSTYPAITIGETSQIGSGGADIGIGLRIQINTDDIWSREFNTGATPVALTVSNFTANGYIILNGSYQI